MPDSFGEELKKLILLGVGAAVTTAEKSKDLIDKLVRKGELTIEQGKVLNEELKHNIKETVKEKYTDALYGSLDKLSKEERAALRKKLEQMDAEKSEG